MAQGGGAMTEYWMIILFGSIWFLAIAIGIGLAWRKSRRRRDHQD